MDIQQVKKNYNQGKISKSEFIDNMYNFHTLLHQYSNELCHTEIQKIEIIDSEIIFTSRATEYHTGNLKFKIDIADKRNVPLETFNFNYYEKEDSEIIFKLIKPDSTIIDIGANIGWYTIHFANLLSSGKVHSFEPLPSTFQKLCDNISLNNLQNIELNNIALSEKEQELNFYFDPNQSGSSSSKNITENNSIEQLVLKSITLDHYIELHSVDKIDFIKCDVEGAELFVFQGGLRSIEKFKPIVFTELLRKWAAKFDYHPNEIIAIFKNFGYNTYYVENQKLVQIFQVDDQTIPTNFFMLHTIKHTEIITTLCL